LTPAPKITAKIAALSDGRNIALDGVRGVAALSVALGHCALIVAGIAVWSKTVFDFPTMPASEVGGRLLHLLFPANGAVMVFFVLSGHVLWASFARKHATAADFPDYVLARLFRLLPLVIAGTFLFLTVTTPTLGETIANMLLLSTSMNGVLWSLQVEMVGSLAIFIAWLFSRDDPVRLIAALCVAAAALPLFRGNPFVVYLPAFLLGALTHYVPARVWRSRALLWLALPVLLLPSLVFSYHGVTRLLEILAGTVIVGCVGVQRPALLERPAIAFLGAVSYPFYLVHPLGIWGALELIGPLPMLNFLFQFVVYALVSLLISLPLAWALHVTVEMPALKIRSRLRRKPTGAPPAAA
jgi:peptidoglycan/LPS O-acetylase OafA/YrhL